MRKRLKTYPKSFLVRGSAYLTLGCLILAMSGLPSPPGVEKDRSVPFPCLDRACGCTSADDCKNHCCCFSDEQKRQWASEHGLDPRIIVSGDELTDVETRSEAPQIVRSHPTSCNEPDTCCCESSESDDAGSTPDGILGWHARRCQGQGPWGLATLTLVLPPTPVAVESPFNTWHALTDVDPSRPPLPFYSPEAPIP